MTEMGASKLTVGLVQMAVESTRDATIQKTLGLVAEAKRRGAELVCLQELYSGPYFCQSEDPAAFELAEPLDGPSVSAIERAAREHSLTILAPVFERRAPGLCHNSALLFGSSGERLSLYRKMHIPDDPQFMEKYYFAPGDRGFAAADTPKARVGTLICWDQWYPEAARLTAMEGAEILLYPTAIGWMPSEKPTEGAAQLDAWKTIQRSHAIANGVFVVATNRVGFEPSEAGGIEFWGHSFVADPMGRIVAEAGEGEEVLIAELDLGMIAETRKWWPFFRDRRIDAYAGITKRWGRE